MNSEIEKAINTLQYELDGIPSDIDKSEFEQAVTIAIKALNQVKRYAEKHPLALECGGEYIMQDDKAQIDALEAMSAIFDSLSE